MKIIFASLIFVVFAFALTACGRIENFTNLTQQKIETEKTETEQPDDPPILEIMQDDKGINDMSGKTLFFNLYDNGVIEFEREGTIKKTAGKINTAEEVYTLERAKITKEELNKFTDLLKTEDFQNIKNEYQRKCCCMRPTVEYKITLTNSIKQKNINLNGYCDLGEMMVPHTEDIGTFPKALSELLILVDITRHKYISR
jgi:hypothetical protein